MFPDSLMRGACKPRGRALAFACTVVLLVGGCSSSTPEQQLRSTIAQMQAAAEAREPRAFIEHVSEDFVGTPGALDREALRNMLRALLMGQKRVGVTLGPLDIKLYGTDRARVQSKVFVTGAGGALDSDSLSLQSDWRLEGGKWQCIAATWQS